MIGSGLADDVEQCIAAGMDGWLPKPIHLQALARTIEDFVRAAKRPRADAGRGEKREAAAGDGEGPFDYAAAVGRFGGSRAMFEQIARLFIDVAPRLLAQISGAICGRDGAGLARAAHTLAGSADVLAAKQASRAAAQVERMAKQGQFESAAAMVPDLELDVRQLVLALEAALGEGARGAARRENQP
jgi:HPt (histidine-containing phosphotransfer) domain-containing protein